MFGVYTSPINSDLYLRHDIVFADSVVEHARIRTAQGRIDSRLISNCGRPAFAVINSYGELSIHDWYTEHAVGRTLPFSSVDGYIVDAAITAHGTFGTLRRSCDYILISNNSHMVCNSLDSIKMMVEAHGNRLYVVGRQQRSRYEPMGEILPCGWYVSAMDDEHTYLNMHSQCAYDNMVAHARLGVLTCMDTRMRDGDIAFQVEFNSCPVGPLDNTHCVFVSETMIGLCDLMVANTDYNSRLVDLRFPRVIYDLQTSGKKAPRGPRIFACV